MASHRGLGGHLAAVEGLEAVALRVAVGVAGSLERVAVEMKRLGVEVLWRKQLWSWGGGAVVEVLWRRRLWDLVEGRRLLLPASPAVKATGLVPCQLPSEQGCEVEGGSWEVWVGVEGWVERVAGWLQKTEDLLVWLVEGLLEVAWRQLLAKELPEKGIAEGEGREVGWWYLRSLCSCFLSGG